MMLGNLELYQALSHVRLCLVIAANFCIAPCPGKYPRLLPSDKSSEMYRKVQDFTEQFSKLNIGVFSYGTMHNEELRKGVRLPQIILRKRLQGEWVWS